MIFPAILGTILLLTGGLMDFVKHYTSAEDHPFKLLGWMCFDIVMFAVPIMCIWSLYLNVKD